MSTNPYIPVQIVDIRTETADTKSFVLKEILPKPISYKPGQFITLVFPKRTGEERRSYSMSSTPLLNEPVTITVKRIDNGEFSRFLFDTCKIGDTLLTIGASGFFTLPEQTDVYKRFFFFAAGSGITPILPLIITILHSVPDSKVYLWYSNRSPQKTIFLKEIEALQKQFSLNFHVEFLFSASQNLLKARMSKLYLADILRGFDRSEKETSLFYLCGPHDYMQMLSITLLTEGIPPDNIRRENFSTVKPVIKELPSDQDKHAVRIHYKGDEHRLEVQYPLTILETAKRDNILLPYSCEAGKCGTCAATCVHGKVWMSYNEVLSDKELEKGRVLTCVGYPVGGDVVLKF